MYRYYKDVFIFFALKFSLLYLLKTRNIQRDRTHPSTRHFILYQIFLIYHDGTGIFQGTDKMAPKQKHALRFFPHEAFLRISSFYFFN